MARRWQDDLPTLDEAFERLKKLPKKAQQDCLFSLMVQLKKHEWRLRRPKEAERLERAVGRTMKRHFEAQRALDEARRG